jgi:acyl carrier protein
LLLQELRTQLASIFELELDAIETDATFVEMGADSLLLGRVTQAVEKRYGIRIGIHQLFDEFDAGRPDTLVAHLSEQLPAEWLLNATATEEVVSEVPVESVQEKTAPLTAAIPPAIPTQSTHEQNAPAIGSTSKEG